MLAFILNAVYREFLKAALAGMAGWWKGDDGSSHSTVCLFQHQHFRDLRCRRVSGVMIGKLLRRPTEERVEASLGLIRLKRPRGPGRGHQLPDGFAALPDCGLPLGILGRPLIAANDNHLMAVHSISGRRCSP